MKTLQSILRCAGVVGLLVGQLACGSTLKSPDAGKGAGGDAVTMALDPASASPQRIEEFPIQVIAADLNGDGKSDLVTVNKDSFGIAVILGKGDGAFQSAVAYSTGSASMGVTAADVNADNKVDLVVSHIGGVSVLLGRGDGTFAAAVNYQANAGPSSVALGDIDKDGKVDLVAVNSQEPGVSILRGAGDGTFSAPVLLDGGGSPLQVALVDMNKDGNLDIVTVYPDTSTVGVGVLWGQGFGAFADEVRIEQYK